MAPDEILHRVQQDGVALVRFLYCDNGNIVRGKAVTAAKLAEFLDVGIGLTVAMQGFTPTERIASDSSLGPVGEIRLIPDPQTFVPLPYAPRQAAMLCDMYTLQGEPWELCPRDALKRAVAAAAAEGLTIQTGFEHEFYLTAPAPEGSVPFDQSLCFSTAGMNSASSIMLEVLDALQTQGLQPVQYYPELGPGQQEVSVQHGPVLQAVDQAIVARETIRGVAQRNGLQATFAPKPFANQAGSGSHIHLSVWQDGRNAFYDNADPLGISPFCYAFIAGILQHLPGLLALTCPSLNSYHRLAPGMWSSAYVCYGPDNREAAVRIASPFRGREAASTNIELKAIDGSANPYLALAGVIAAGMDGVKRQLQPGEAMRRNPSTLDKAEREQLALRRFPESSIEAAAAFESDDVLLSALGRPLAREALAVRRSEWEDLYALPILEQIARYRVLY